MIIKKSFVILLLISALSGCTNIGAYVLSNPGIYLAENGFINAKPERLGFESKQFCSKEQAECIPYLVTEPYQASDYPDGKSVFYNLHSFGNGVENNISHRMTPDTFNRIAGTAVLLHGYGGSKEVMMATAIYFRALGMKVVIPDLYGHGDTNQAFAFAAKEHKMFEQLLSQLHTDSELTSPVLVVGHSLGALAAVKLLLESDLTTGAILLAPMLRFDLAAKQYLPHKAPTLSRLFIEQIDNIVSKALNEANVELKETDIVKLASQTSKPILIINSDVDTVSPQKHFLPLNGNNIEFASFNGRSHSSLIAFSTEDTLVLERWIASKL